MKCPKCQTDNPQNSKYCAECATRLDSSISPSFTMTMETSADELTRGLVLAGRYEIIEELGTGGMGKVFRVFDKKMDEEVALKLIKPEIAANKQIVERFRNEIKIARKITHKNVCRMHDLNEEGQTLYLTMEYVRGEDLKSLVHRTKHLAPETTVSIVRQIAEGLAEAHKLGIIHRDLKPQNIMIDKEGNAKIMDFGIARSLQTQGLTGEKAIIGTPEYMSPEQVEGKETDPRSDIYSLGVILYEMLTGRVPFEDNTPLSVALKHKTEPPQDPQKINPQITKDLALLVLRCLEKSKESRFHSAEELIAELSRIEEGIPSAGKVLPIKKSFTSEETTKTFKKRWRLVASLAILVVMAATAVYYLTRETPGPSSAPRKKRLVVLPFENIGPAEDEYFADGITDEIIARMTNVSDLNVIARNSSIQYKKTTKPLQQIGAELNVDYVLSGTIRWQKPGEGQGRVRVVPSLTKVSDSIQVWANVYDESIVELFQVQSDISKKVTDALGIALREPEKRALEIMPTRNMQAYDYYLRGNDLVFQSNDQKATRLAIENYEKAVSLDPNFYQAFARLAQAQAKYYFFHYDHSPDRSAKAKDAVDKAYRLNPHAPEIHTAQGYYYYWCQMDYEKALEHFSFSLEKQPQNTPILEGIAYIKRRQGKLDEAMSYLKKASELDPLSINTTFQLGVSYLLLRDYQEAEKCFNRTLILNPENILAYYRKTCLSFYQGDTKKARQVLEEASRTLRVPDPNLILYPWILVDIFERKYDEALQRLTSDTSEAFSYQFYFVPKSQLLAQIYGLMKNPQMEKRHYESAVVFLEGKIREDPEDPRYHSALGIAYAGLGRKKDAILAAEKAIEILPVSKEFMTGAFRARDLAQVYTMVAEYDKAFDLIEQLLSITGEMSVQFLRLDPVWTPLLTHPRFKKLKPN